MPSGLGSRATTTTSLATERPTRRATRTSWGHTPGGYNKHSLGECYEGGLDKQGTPDDTRTPLQKRALLRLLRRLKKAHPDARILGHRDLPNVHKACPCFDAIKEYSSL